MPASPVSALDSPRTAVTAMFASFGMATGLWAGSIPAVTAAAGIGDAGLGLGLTLYTVAYVAMMVCGGVLARFAGNRTILLAGLPFVTLCGALLLTGATPALFYPAITLFGATLGLLDLFMNAEGSYVESEARRPIFTSFHAAASAATAVFAIIGSLLTAGFGTAASGAAMILALALVWCMAWRSLPERNIVIARPSGRPDLAGLTPLLALGLAAGLVIAGETAAIMWSAKLLDEQAPDLAAIAGLGAAFFAGCTAIVRFAGDSSRARFGDVPLMLASLAIAAAGFMLVGLSDGFWMSAGAFALVGFGTACVIPIIFTLAAGHMAANRAAGIAIVSLVAGLPRALAPVFFGWIAALVSTGFAFGLCALAMLIALGLIFALRTTYGVPAPLRP